MSRHISLSEQMEDFDRQRDDLELAKQVERETREMMSASVSAAEARAEAAEFREAETLTRLSASTRYIETYETEERPLLIARIREMEARLQPFALEADLWAESTDDDYKPLFAGNHMGPRATFSVGDLRRARKCATMSRTSL